jgi:lipopolysaccharide export system permease protein
MVIYLYNFSKDGEMLVLFSLGKSPKSVINLYLLLSFIISISLIVNSLILMPLSEQASHNFLKIKKVESKINVKSSEIGQKVGNWHIFTKRADDFVYNDLVLFSANYKNKEQLILSKSAKFDSFGDSISLTLRDGVHYMIGNDRIVQTNFETLKLTNAIYKDKLDNKTILEYWLDAKTDKYRSRWLTIYMLLSLFPLLSLFLAFSVGIINTRVQRRVVSFWMALVVIVYYGFTFKIAEISPLYGGVGFLTIFLLVSFLVVRKMILKRY